MDLTFDQARDNLKLMYKNPDAIYGAKENGELGAVSKWNILGRLYYHWKGYSNLEKVTQTVLATFKELNKDISVNNFKIKHPDTEGFWGRFVRLTYKEVTLPWTVQTSEVKKIDFVRKNDSVVKAINEFEKHVKEVANKK